MAREGCLNGIVENLPFAATGDDEREVIWEGVRAVRRRVPFDGWCWIPLDPDTGLPAGPHVGDNQPLRENGLAPRLVSFEFGEGEEFNRIDALMRQPNPVGVLSVATDGDLSRSARWREILSLAGIGDELRALHSAAGACWGCLNLFRERSGRRFTQDEANLAGEIAALLGRAARRFAVKSLPNVTAADGPGVLVLDPETGRWTANDTVEGYMRGLSRPDGEGNDCSEMPPSPAVIYALAARVRARERDGAASWPPARVRARTTGGQWLTISASRLSGTGGIAVVFEPARPADIAPLFLRFCATTRRERELIGLILRGQSTKAIARELAISPYTVQDHLKAIFAKTGVRNRRELMARLAA